MALINDIHNIINFATDKGVTGYHKPEDIDNEIHAVSTDLWQKFYDDYARTKKISSYMAPFEVKDVALVADGFMSKSIEHPTLVMYGDVEVSMRERYQWAKEINDPVAPPTVEYPICLFSTRNAQGIFSFEVLPAEASPVTIYGLKKPTKAVWAYTIDTAGRRVFDEANSTDIEWSELLFNDIRNKVLKIMGINLRESHIMQFNQALTADTE